MTHKVSFEPKWTNPPGATVLDLLQERGLPVGELAHLAHKDIESVSRLLFGAEPLTPDWAERLSEILGSPPTFWLRREELYRTDLKRLCEAVIDCGADAWLHNLPLKDMIRFGWIRRGSSAHETALNVCAFLGVTTAGAFERKYKDLLSASAFRTSTAFATQPSAVITWLRQGEIASTAIDCARWNEVKLHQSLDIIRALTREKDPATFLPRLRGILAACGVAIVITRAPKQCRASGATRFLNADKALIQLSFRYLADDQFWFTVFHEIGHLLLHVHGELFLEGLEKRASGAEAEANEFARNTLFAKVGVDALDHIGTTKFDIARFARRAGIAPGIVVGQLQDRGRIPFKHFNFLKVRYSWAD